MNKEIDITGIELKTERLVLRPFKLDDLNDFYEYAKVDGVGEMAGWKHHESIEESKEILNMFIESKKTFAISLNSKVIGSLGIERYDEKELPEYDTKLGREIGYVLSKDYWGNGFITEAVKRVIDYLFNDEQLDFIVAGHFKTNEKSFRVQEKCGFKHVKEIKYKTRMGTVIDGYLSILLK